MLIGPGTNGVYSRSACSVPTETAADATRADEARLTEAVQIARAHGKSWNQIAVALGVSRQAARRRFADKLPI
jgi:hypothetical protein